MSDRTALETAARMVHEVLPPTPARRWPLLEERAGCTLWVKHENHAPTGAFKVRGGLTYMHALRRDEPGVRGVLAATRGNHGQSVAFAARRQGLAAESFWASMNLDCTRARSRSRASILLPQPSVRAWP